MGPGLPAAKGELKPLGQAWGALGACSTQGCSQLLAGRLGDNSVFLASCPSYGRPQHPPNHSWGRCKEPVLHFPAFPQCWGSFSAALIAIFFPISCS